MKKATGAAVANFIREHIITRFRIPRRLISDNGTLFINKDMKELTEAYYIKHGRFTHTTHKETARLRPLIG